MEADGIATDRGTVGTGDTAPSCEITAVGSTSAPLDGTPQVLVPAGGKRLLLGGTSEDETVEEPLCSEGKDSLSTPAMTEECAVSEKAVPAALDRTPQPTTPVALEKTPQAATPKSAKLSSPVLLGATDAEVVTCPAANPLSPKQAKTLEPQCEAAPISNEGPSLGASADPTEEDAPGNPKDINTDAWIEEAAKKFGIDEFKEEQDFSSEPLETRIGSKNLERRCSAFSQLQNSMLAGEQDAFDFLWSHLDSCLSESLPKGQEAALSALAVFLEKRSNIASESEQLLGIVRKLVDNKFIDKPKMQQLVPPVIALIVEVCECPAVVSCVLECLSGVENAKKKSVGFFKKQVAFIIKLIYSLLADFGVVRMNLKLGYLNVVMKYIADSDRGLRDACYSVLIELSAWLGDISEAIKPMDDQHKKELVKRLESIKEEERVRGAPRRIYRTDAPGAGALKVDANQEVDGLKKLPKGWCLSKVTSMEKWVEKQKHLKVLSEVLDVPCLAWSDAYTSMVSVFVRLIKTESNIPIVTESAKCTGLMARGLKKDFEKGARQLLPVALARINDKSVWKPNILIEMVENLLWSVPFETFFEELRPSIASKSLFVKKEAIGLLLRTLELEAVQQRCPDASQRYLQALAAAVLPAIDDSDNLVRHEAAKFLAVLVHRNGESPDVGQLVLDKVPAHRRSTFEEEWKKIAGGQACSMACADLVDKPRATAPATPRRTGADNGCIPTPRRARQAEAIRANRPASPAASSVPASPAKPKGSGVVKGAPEMHAEVRSRSASRDNSMRQPSNGETQQTPRMVQEMAKEIKSLRNIVEKLQSGPEQSHCVQQGRRLRTPASNGLGQRADSVSSHTGLVASRPNTPTPAVRQRIHQENSRSATPHVHEGTCEERRFSGGTSPAPCGRTIATPRGREATLRAPSNESRLRRDGSCSSLHLESIAAASANQSGFVIEAPRQAKLARQLKEKSQYWGPDAIPAEFLASLKETWRPCLEQTLWQSMFSERMDEQLHALQRWRHQVRERASNTFEVLDMALKWLTWMLSNTNTQIWKLTLEVLSCMLAGMAAEGMQLTDREAQILLPNILERSGHNISSIKESMLQILQQALALYPSIRAAPSLLHGLTSKNKRSVACAMSALGFAMDRQLASWIARTSKDAANVLRMLDSKDVDIRKAALQTVASMSVHMESDAYSRISKGLSASMQHAIRSVAVRLAPSASRDGSFAGSSSINVSSSDVYTDQCEAGVTLQRAVPGALTGSLQERRQAAISPQKSRTSNNTLSTASSPPKTHRAPSISSLAGHSPGTAYHRMDSPLVDDHKMTVGGAQSSQRSTPLSSTPSDRPSVAELAKEMLNSNNENFRTICAALAERVKLSSDFDSIPMADALIPCMRMYFGNEGCCERYCPLVLVLDEFCASRDCVRPLPSDRIRGLLRELLRNLNKFEWTKRFPDGATLLRRLNLSCVMLLNNISRPKAYCLLLELGTDESEVVGSSLILKCLKKLNKQIGSCKNPEQEVHSILEVICEWLRRVHPRLQQAPVSGAARGIVDAAIAGLIDGVREITEAAQQACPHAAASWQQQASGDHCRQMFIWLTKEDFANGKENRPTPDVMSKEVANKEHERQSIVKKRSISPGKVMPCGTLNGQP